MTKLIVASKEAMTDKPIALDAYEALAEAYAAAVDTKPHNASENYFRNELVGTEWRGFGVRVYMPSFRRSLGETLNPIINAGFRIENILEPKPTDKFKEADPEEYEELSRQPSFLCIRARK
jgi:hypothetical protein